MVYLARADNEEMIITHEVMIKAAIKKGVPEDFKKFIEEKVEKWRKVSIKSVNFEENILKLIVYTSEPNYFSMGTIIPPDNYPKIITVASSYLLRPLKAIENETRLYLWHPDLKLPEGIEVDEKTIEVAARQILSIEERDKFIILY